MSNTKKQEQSWALLAEPNEEFNGYDFFHFDGHPTEWQIGLYPDNMDKNCPIWIMIPSCNVYILWRGNEKIIGKAVFDDDEDRWKFEFRESYGYWYEDEDLEYLMEGITEQLDDIINDGASEWWSWYQDKYPHEEIAMAYVECGDVYYDTTKHKKKETDS
jgi:hypothetical protein